MVLRMIGKQMEDMDMGQGMIIANIAEWFFFVCVCAKVLATYVAAND